MLQNIVNQGYDIGKKGLYAAKTGLMITAGIAYAVLLSACGSDIELVNPTTTPPPTATSTPTPTPTPTRATLTAYVNGHQGRRRVNYSQNPITDPIMFNGTNIPDPSYTTLSTIITVENGAVTNVLPAVPGDLDVNANGTIGGDNQQALNVNSSLDVAGNIKLDFSLETQGYTPDQKVLNIGQYFIPVTHNMKDADVSFTPGAHVLINYVDFVRAFSTGPTYDFGDALKNQYAADLRQMFPTDFQQKIAVLGGWGTWIDSFNQNAELELAGQAYIGADADGKPELVLQAQFDQTMDLSLKVKAGRLNPNIWFRFDLDEHNLNYAGNETLLDKIVLFDAQ